MYALLLPDASPWSSTGAPAAWSPSPTTSSTRSSASIPASPASRRIPAWPGWRAQRLSNRGNMTTSAPENLVYDRPEGFTEAPTHYCPGCTHGVAHRLVAEVLEEMNVLGKTIGVAPVGCAVFAYNYFDTDFVEAPHGRAPAMATGIKRVLPDRVVFTYQGDGD